MTLAFDESWSETDLVALQIFSRAVGSAKMADLYGSYPCTRYRYLKDDAAKMAFDTAEAFVREKNNRKSADVRSVDTDVN